MSTVTLLTSNGEGEELTYSKDVMFLNETIKNMVEDCGCDTIPVPQSADLYRIAYEFCEHFNSTSSLEKYEQTEPPLAGWDADFINKMDNDTIYDVLHLADYLHNPPFFDVMCKAMAAIVKGIDDPAEIVKLFPNRLTLEDFDEETIDSIKKENLWAKET